MPAISDPRVRTLGLRTHLAVESERSIVEEHEDFVAVRTPGNPDYHFGNLLIFDRPPRAGDEDRWPERFEQIFGAHPPVRHAAFAWSADDDRGAVEPFLRRGYTFQHRAVLTAATVNEFPAPPGLRVRPFRCENDWNAQLQLGLAVREEQYEAQTYARFKAAQVLYHRQITGAFGVWLGAFEGDRLAGSCGIFSIGDGIARYQDVSVLPEYRNRGIARCLTGAAGRFALDRFGSRRLVIVADAGDFPRKIYERVGFTLYQREGALWIAAR